MSDAEKLDMLAEWFDRFDLLRGKVGDREVQTDLRRIAIRIRNYFPDGNLKPVDTEAKLAIVEQLQKECSA